MMLAIIISMVFVAGLITARAANKVFKSNFVYSLLFVAGLVTIDQLLKLLVIMNYPECKYAIVKYFIFKIGDFDILSLTHIRNNGAGWSILGGHTVLLTVSTAVVIVGLLIYMFIRRKKISSAEMISICLIIAGGFGNLIDRFRMLIEGTDRFPGVVDYIKFDFIEWPVFNFADCCVVVGAVMFCFIMLKDEFFDSKEKKRAKRLLAAAEKESGADNGDESV